jgi:protein-tyrosine phosphatase
VGTIEESREHASVLMVCTGNICRSPAAERLARHHWGSHGDITVTSAGTGALVGEPINLSMRHLMLLDALDTVDFAARHLTSQLVAGSDVILGMTTRHRKGAISMDPASLRKTFTLMEFARIAEAAARDLRTETPADRLREIVEVAHLHRAPGEGDEINIRDPFGHGTEVYEMSYGAIKQSVLTVSRVIGTS